MDGSIFEHFDIFCKEFPVLALDIFQFCFHRLDMQLQLLLKPDVTSDFTLQFLQ